MNNFKEFWNQFRGAIIGVIIAILILIFVLPVKLTISGIALMLQLIILVMLQTKKY